MILTQLQYDLNEFFDLYAVQKDITLEDFEYITNVMRAFINWCGICHDQGVIYCKEQIMIVENILYLFQMVPNDIVRDEKIFWILVSLSVKIVPSLYRITKQNEEDYFWTKVQSWKNDPNVKGGFGFNIQQSPVPHLSYNNGGIRANMSLL